MAAFVQFVRRVRGGKQASSPQYLIPSLFALAVCYTLIGEFIFFNTLLPDPDEACSADPGEDDSAHCSELQLFKQWHKEAEIEEPDESLLLIAETPPAAASAPPATAAAAAQAVGTPDSTDTVPRTEVDTIAGAKSDQEHHSLRQAQFDKLEQELRTSLADTSGSLTPWAKDLEEQEQHAEAEFFAEEDKHHEPTAQEKKIVVEWQAQVDKLGAIIHHALHADSNAVWASDLESLKHRLELQMSYHMRRYAGHDDKVFAIRHEQLEKLEEALHASPNAHFRVAWDKLGSSLFELQQMRVRLEFEMSSHALKQHGAPTLSTVAEHGGQTEEQLEVGQDETLPPKNMTTHIAANMVELERGLADLVSDRFKHAPVIQATTAAPTGFLHKQLQWSSVLGMSRSILIGGASHTHQVVSKKELRHLQWSEKEKIPKVSCITAISFSRHTRARMMYFVDNFKLQDYEGERQLLLVYHASDTDAAELVKKYADGITIKGVAAPGGSIEHFPTNKALRYGAWAADADADVIARWEFDEWHDPSRLSMQVRALAATARPACIVGTKPITDQKLVVADTSLAGARSWMKVYWKPLPLHESEEEVVPPPEAHIVQLKMQNVQLTTAAGALQPFSKDTEKVEANSVVMEVDAKAVVKEELEDAEVHEWTMKECLELESSADIPGLRADSGAVMEKQIGHYMSKIFDKLIARRHDITQKLQLLCMETTMESDMKEHAFKRQHVDQMMGIRAELDKHIALLVSNLLPDIVAVSPDLK